MGQDDQLNKVSADAQLAVTIDAESVSTSNHASGIARPPRIEQVLALTTFIVYHLDVMHLLDFFSDWRFLICAGILGVCCQEVALCSGSLWPGIVLHGTW